MTIADWIICFILQQVFDFSIRVWTAILFDTFSEIKNSITRNFSFAASALMQIRCVSSSEIRIRRSPNEKSWMKNPFKRQSQSSPSSGSSFSARWIEIRFQIRSDVVSQAATGRRIYLRGSALPAVSSAASHRNLTIPLVPRSSHLQPHIQPS